MLSISNVMFYICSRIMHALLHVDYIYPTLIGSCLEMTASGALCCIKLHLLMIFLSGYFDPLFFVLFYSSLQTLSFLCNPFSSLLALSPHLLSSSFSLTPPDIFSTTPFTRLFSSSQPSPCLEKHGQSKWAKAAAGDSVIDKSPPAGDRGLSSAPLTVQIGLNACWCLCPYSQEVALWVER